MLKNEFVAGEKNQHKPGEPTQSGTCEDENIVKAKEETIIGVGKIAEHDRQSEADDVAADMADAAQEDGRNVMKRNGDILSNHHHILDKD